LRSPASALAIGNAATMRSIALGGDTVAPSRSGRRSTTPAQRACPARDRSPSGAHFHPRGARAMHAELHGGGVTEIDDAPSWNGPRSFTRTITDLPLARLVTRANDGSGSVLCAALKAYMSYTSSDDVRRPWNLVP
jgi:hypothetical protein